MESYQYPSSGDEDLKFENELKKLMLKAEFGTGVVNNIRSCPWREQEWLKDVEQFERKYADRKWVTVFEFIGSPQEICSPEEVSVKHIAAALSGLQERLLQYQITVESMCGISAKEMYRFMVEDVLLQEIEVERNMPMHFLYETSYPNDAYDVRVKVEAFLHTVFENKWITLEGSMGNKIQTFKPTPIKKEVMISRLKNWLSFYSEIQLVDLQFEKISIEKNMAVAAACIQYEATLEGGFPNTKGEIFANFQLKHKSQDNWQLTGIFIPGVQ